MQTKNLERVDGEFGLWKTASGKYLVQFIAARESKNHQSGWEVFEAGKPKTPDAVESFRGLNEVRDWLKEHDEVIDERKDGHIQDGQDGTI